VIASNGAVSKVYYEIDSLLQLRRATNSSAENTLRTAYSLSNASFALDAASVIRAEGTNRFRLPRSSPAYDVAFAAGWPRGVREVVTERQMFQAHGTFYELPLSGSGGFRKVRPITTHGRHISDCASWRGLFVFAGVAAGATNNGHVIRSEDGQAALWFGNVDDLWRMGAPWGVGGPWKDSFVIPGIPSDPYLMFGYEHKILELSHTNSSAGTFTVEVDFAANNSWSEYVRLTVQPGEVVKHVFPEGYSSHWVRLTSDAATSATAWLTYGPAAPRITSTQMPSAGGFGFTFTGPLGWPYRVRASQDPAVPLAAWPSMTNGSFTGGDILYHDPASTGFGCRFYSISVP